MTPTITAKADGAVTRVEAPGEVVLSVAGVVTMPFGPEAVARFDKVGDDMVLLLKDGSRIVLRDFFVVHDGARSDLVFVDESDVTWWAQYDEPWRCFDIAEIEAEPLAAVPPANLLGALAALAAGGAAAAAGGGGSDDSPRDDPSAAVEAGAVDGGVPQVQGNVFDNDPVASTVTQVSTRGGTDRAGGRPVAPGAPLEGAYGALTLQEDGSYAYALDNALDATQALAAGETATETFTYGTADGAFADVVITITGANDAPAITGADSGAVAEEATRTTGGQLEVGDPDAGDAHAWAIEPGQQGRYGTFAVDGTGAWTYALDGDRADVQALRRGDTLSDSVLVRVTDREGATTTRTVTVAIDGVNDRPVARDDASTVVSGSAVARDVRTGDTDVDTGEAGALRVTRIGDAAIAPDAPVAVTGGTVSIDAAGVLTFTHDGAFSGVVAIPYTVDDGSGATDSEGGATWTVTVEAPPTVAIRDDASPADADTPDGTLSSVDDLGAVAIDGQVPTDATIVSLAVTDGTTVVAIAPGDVLIAPDGSFTTTADLTGLSDGTLTVTLTVEDAFGTRFAPTSEMEKDTETAVAIDPVAARDDEAPVLTGTGREGDVVEIRVGDDAFATVTVGAGGTWSYAPPDPLDDPEVTVAVTATDALGNVARAERDVVSAVVADAVPAAPEDIVVDEAGLPDGTAAAAGGARVTSTIAIGTGDGPITEVTIGGTTIPLAALEGSGTTPAGPIATTYGALTVTGYDAGAGTLTFEYVLDEATDAHGDPGADVVREDIAVVVVDRDGDSRETRLTVAVRDDAPAAALDDADPASLRASDGDLGTDPSTSFAGLFDVDPGADGLARIGYALSVDGPASGLVDAATGDAIVLSLEDGVVVGRAGGPTGPVAFAVSVDPATGVVELDQRRPLDQGAGGDGAIASIVDAAVRLTATATDGDGDTAEATADIGARLAFADDGPVARDDPSRAVAEGGAAIGTDAGAANLFDNDGLGADGARIDQVRYVDANGDPATAAIAPGAAGTGPLATRFGALEVGADGTWSFAPDASVRHAGGSDADAGFGYRLVDGDGDTAEARQPIAVTDTAPVAVDDDPRSTPEGGASLSGTVTDDDSDSADGGTAVASFTYTDAAGARQTFAFGPGAATATVATPTGALTVGADGAWSFAPADAFDHDAPGADPAAGGFTYVLVDADGSTSDPAEQPLTVTDTQPSAGTASVSLDEADLPGAGSAGATGSDPTATEPLAIAKGRDAIADVVFTQATIDGLPALSSRGTALVYSVSSDGHALTARAGAAGPVAFTLAIDDPDDATGAAQAVTATLSAPIDQAGATRTALDVAYVIRDADGAVDGSVSFEIADDAPDSPEAGTPVAVVEGAGAAGAVGSANGGEPLLANDVLGADGGRVSSIGYTARDGSAATAQIAAGASETVQTRHGELAVASDGTWSYVPVEAADHDRASGDDAALSDDFTYATVDGDGDPSPGAATQKVTVADTTPAIGDPDDRTVSEASLGNGSAPDAPATTRTGSLDVTPGADAVAVTLVGTPAGIASGGVALFYATSADGRTVEAFAGQGGPRVFTLAVTAPTAGSAGYRFTLERPLDHGEAATLDLGFTARVTDADGDGADAPFTVTVVDDVAEDTITRTIPEDGSFSVNTSADAEPGNTTILQGGNTIAGQANGAGGIDYEVANGTVTVNADGSLTYEPDADYSGDESFVARTDDGTVTTTTVEVTVTPVSDAPTLGAGGDVATREDTFVALGLVAPTITDATGISERIDAVTLTGLPEGARLRAGGAGAPLLTVGTEPVAIVISDVPTVNGATGTLTLTSAQFEALQARPPAQGAENFSVSADVSSFEVDADGDPVAPGAAAPTATVDVSVQAVTDPATLTFDDAATAGGVSGVDAVAYSQGDTVADVTVREDARFNLRDILEAAYPDDLDGSEARSIEITNNTGERIFLGGQNLNAGSTATIAATDQDGGIGDFPNIPIGAARNFSGSLDGIEVTLVARDVDPDGFGATAGPANGVAEADVSDNTVTLNLDVTAVAGDVSNRRLGVSTAEDRPATFLENIRVTDTSSGPGGREVITKVSFDVPAGWTYADSGVSNGAAFSVAASGQTRTITFTSGTQPEREAVLDGFTLTPPAHSSADATVAVVVTTRDDADVRDVTRDVAITVDPVAEVTTADSDGDGADDVTLTPGNAYSAPGEEDMRYALNRGGFDLSAGWSNEDGDEATLALMTPEVNGAPAIGARFFWQEGGAERSATFGGAPVRIPVGALATAEFLPPPDESGRFTIGVQALTRDFDDDSEGSGTPAEATSGSAQLVNVDIQPVADKVALTLSARAVGPEDTPIPLSVRPSSSDPGETFTVTIRGIPEGATVSYDGGSFTATPGATSLEITEFDADAPLTVQPPANSNADFQLTVDAVAVDTADFGTTTTTDFSDPPVSLAITVAVQGVADPAAADATAPPPTYDEAEIDGGTDAVEVRELVSFTRADGDGSEALTVRVSGLPDGFSVSEGTLVTPPSETGTDRVWALSEADVAVAVVEVPANFSGERSFTVEPVTTENDGNSTTGAPTSVTFRVTPAPEARVSDGAVLVEDEVTTLGFRIVPQNGDDDERIASVRIRQDEADDEAYVLHLGTGGDAVPLSAAGLPTQTEGGVAYYVLTPEQAGTLSALADPELDRGVGDFEVQYRVTDDGFGATVGPTATTSPYRSQTFTLTASPVTDAPDATITAMSAANAGSTTTITDDTAGDDADPDTAVLSQPDVVTVAVNVASPDEDGSERVTRIIVEDVPQGVTVNDAESIGPGRWLLKFIGADAVGIGASGATIPVTFDVGDTVASTAPERISMTVQVRDRGDEGAAGTLVREDTVAWTLQATYGTSGTTPPDPAAIDEWSYNGEGVTEDVPTALSALVVAEVAATSTAPNTLTVQLTDVPEGALIDGMARTVIGGVETFTASATSVAGEDAAQVQARLDALLDSIVITAPEDSNENNAPGALSFTARLNTSVQGGATAEEDVIAPTVPVEPVTDAAAISIALGASDDDGELDESDTAVPISITVENDADGAFGSVVGGELYLRIEGSEPELRGGTLTSVDGTETYDLEQVSGVGGIDDGLYHVIPDTPFGTRVDVVYTPPGTVAGDVTVTATVVNVEAGAARRTSSEAGTLTIAIGNDGARAQSDRSSGPEASDQSSASIIPLAGLSAELADDDGSEAFVSTLLTGVPQGFLVYAGNDATDATVAAPSSNAGGDGSVNTWILSGEGEPLPAFVGLLPPQYFSGTIAGLALVVNSGETALDDVRSDTFAVADVTVTPVADGVEATTSSAFGTDGEITSLNLNVAIVDPDDATTSAAFPDENRETATLVITGLGSNASFYADAGAGLALLAQGVTYDAGADAYTVAGLSQAQVDSLSFRQAANAVTDQDAGEADIQIAVSASTVDGADTSDPVATEVTLSFFDQVPTSGDDRLLWTGLGLDALDGEDTVDFRIGEDLSGDDVAGVLENVEVLGLAIGGANVLRAFAPDDLVAITDGDDALTVNGTADDRVVLEGDWVDAGGGIYTGTPAGAPGTTATLTVTGGAQVELPPAAPAPAAFAAPASFGLASLGGGAPAASRSFATATLPAQEEVLASGGEGSLDGLLPADAVTGAPRRTPVADAPAGIDLASGPRASDDETHDAAVYDA